MQAQQILGLGVSVGSHCDYNLKGYLFKLQMERKHVALNLKLNNRDFIQIKLSTINKPPLVDIN